MVYRQWRPWQFWGWRHVSLFLFFALLIALLWTAYGRPFGAELNVPDTIRSSLSFIPNAGQSDAAVHYMAHSHGMSVFFTDDGLTFSGMNGETGTTEVVGWQFAGANTAEIRGTNGLPGAANYLYGQDPEKWHTGLPTYGAVRYEGLYPGVDVSFGGGPGRLEAAFHLEAGADPAVLQWQFDGVRPQLDSETGVLELMDGDGRTVIEFEPPLVRQQGADEAEAGAGFVVNENGTVAVAAAGADGTAPLAIFMTANLSRGMMSPLGIVDGAMDVASNSAFETFVTGHTNSSFFPTAGPLQAENAGGLDVFVTKFSADGDVLFSTYLGGSDSDDGVGIDVDSAGNVILSGYTHSTDFPLANAVMGDQPGEDSFISKISADGSQLLFSTYLGGSGNDRDTDVAVSDQNDIYVSGRTFSTDFPLLNPIQGTFGGGDWDSYLTKISGDSYQLLFSTYLGGNDWDSSGGIDVDQNGDVFVTGWTTSADFPVANTGIPQPQTGPGNSSVFVSKVAGDGSSLLFSAMFGGSSLDFGHAVSIDPLGNALVVGDTDSNDFPTVDPIQPTNHGESDAFVTSVAGDGSGLLFSTYFGGSSRDSGMGIVVGGAGNVFVTGTTQSNDFPQLNPIPGMGYPGQVDAFVAMQSGMGNLVWSTYLGGTFWDFGNAVDVDDVGRPVVVGTTYSFDFPTANAFQPGLNDAPDGFVGRLSHAGDMLEFSTYLGGGGYPGTPTDVAVSEVGKTAEPNPTLYLLALALLIMLLAGAWLVRSRSGY